MEQKIITIDVPATVAVKRPEPKREDHRDLSTLYAMIAGCSIILNIILALR